MSTMGMIRSLAIQLVPLFFAALMLTPQAMADGCVGGCMEGTSCRSHKEPGGDNSWVWSCVPDEAANCQGPCSGGGFQTYVNGRCQCSEATNNDNKCVGPCPNGNIQRWVNGGCTCNSDNGGNNSGTNNQNQQSCQQRYQQLKDQCTTNIDDASYSCDEKNDSGMSDVTNTGAQLALMMGQQTSSSIQAACSRMADYTQAANGALAAYRLTCSNSISSCKSACSSAKTYLQQNSQCVSGGDQSTATSLLSTADSNLKRCNDFDAKVNQAQQAIQNYGATSANASQCASLTAGNTNQAPTEFCKVNPTHVSCQPAVAADCSNPEVAATNKVCVCARTPNDPMCGGTNKAGGDTVGTGGSIDSASRLAGGTENFGGDIPDTPGIAHGKMSPGGGEGIDGSQGGGTVGGGSGGSSGGGSAARGGGGGSSDESANVNGGFYGGGGSRGFGSGSYGGDGGSGSGGAGYRGGATGAGGPQGPDLRKFLPGGQFDPKRGISGMGGPDGITGPHSNIWEKIQNRYKVMSPTLLP